VIWSILSRRIGRLNPAWVRQRTDLMTYLCCLLYRMHPIDFSKARSVKRDYVCFRSVQLTRFHNVKYCSPNPNWPTRMSSLLKSMLIPSKMRFTLRTAYQASTNKWKMVLDVTPIASRKFHTHIYKNICNTMFVVKLSMSTWNCL